MKHLLFLLLTVFTIPGICQTNQRPNVILIITDDQGYGDLGYHGNPIIQTPHLDKLAAASVRLNNFYVSPVCAPTRSSLMTGRYSLRTGVHDTYNGGAIMASGEVTIAEVLKKVGYKTGAFGKWHLGDNFPSRPGDQGFDESVIHQAGGMGQPGDFTTYFKFDRSYFDPVLWHNGQQESYNGYCSDIFTGEAIKFIEQNKEGSFFCYLAYNAPHTPLQVPDEYYRLYREVDPAQGFDGDDRPFPEMTEKDKEDARRVYAMVTNIDDNIGKVLQKLKDMGIDDHTVVIFMTDNGPQQRRYIAGLRGRKGSVYRGGVRVPFFIRYPGKWKGDKDIKVNTAHIDILPTLASICNAPLPRGVKIDGRDLLPVIRGERVEWENRSLFFYWTRKYPELYNNMALQKGPLKLVGHTSFDAEINGFQLFNIESDPFELENLVGDKENLALQLKEEMDACYYELTASPHLVNQPRIAIGTEHENPVYLNRNDASGERGVWTQEERYGKWVVSIARGTYDVEYVFIKPVGGQGTLYLEAGTLINQKSIDQDKTDRLIMENVFLPEMDTDLIPFYLVDDKRYFPLYLKITRIE
ncbi:MAG: arylsulfatase [Bacteroides sp. SM23_62]|nr:MAG: arylsulfatase [Bacteroides sp. SM23_62]